MGFIPGCSILARCMTYTHKCFNDLSLSPSLSPLSLTSPEYSVKKTTMPTSKRKGNETERQKEKNEKGIKNPSYEN
jgi:hypothetical protein